MTFAPSNQQPPDTKGLSVKQTIKVEVEHALDLIVHNVNIPWVKVTAALNRVAVIVEASSRESFGSVRTASSVEAELRETARKWRDRAEKAEREFEGARKALSESVATVERLRKEVDTKVERSAERRRALEKVKPIIDTMLLHFKPEPGKEAPLWGDEGADPKAFDADGVAYGEKLGIGELRYGDLEVARGALLGVGVV